MLKYGYELVDDFITSEEVEFLVSDLDKLKLEDKRGGIRNVEKKSSSVFKFSSSTKMLQMASKYLNGTPKLGFSAPK